MRVALFSHTTGYQLRAFNDAAARLGVELMFATDRCRNLDDPWQDHAVAVRFHDTDTSVAAIVDAARRRPVNGVIAVGDRPVGLAAAAAEALGIPWHSVAGAQASTDKRRSRTMLAAAGLPSPRFSVMPLARATDVARHGSAEPDAHEMLRGGSAAAQVGFPCVLKPLGLSGSRGVIRANTPGEFRAAAERIRALLARPLIRTARAGLEDAILVEAYIGGDEFALEGVLTHGALRTFALFDKPDPLVGPFFEETIYATPSRLEPAAQRAIGMQVERAARALGLRHGPVHAECRVTPDGEVYVLEVAARPIGGLCSRVLTFAGDASLEEVLLRHALGQPIDAFAREPRGAAVMMMPIPRRGILRGVSGEDAARAVPGVTDVRITAKRDQLLEPLPEAGSYLGFIFARGATAADAERAVRDAYTRLAFTIDREIALSLEP